MARRAKQQTISPKLYRQFAAVTVAITLTIAIFADGESRQAIADEVAERDRKPAAREANADRFGAPKLIVEKPKRAQARDSFGTGQTTFGQPTLNPSRGGVASSQSGSGSGRVSAVTGTARERTLSDFGISDEEIASLSPEERAAFLQRLLNERYGRSSAVDRAMIAKSRARSGTATPVAAY